MPTLVTPTVFGNRLILDLLNRVIDIPQNLLHQAISSWRDLGNRCHRLGPLRWCRRHFATLLVVFLDSRDLAHELAL
jgi:hypothetical protein